MFVIRERFYAHPVVSFGFTLCSVRDRDFEILRKKPCVHTMYIWIPCLIKRSSPCKKEGTPMQRQHYPFVCDVVTESLVTCLQKLSHSHEIRNINTGKVVLHK